MEKSPFFSKPLTLSSSTTSPSQLLAILNAGHSILPKILSSRTSGHLFLNSIPLRPSLVRRISSHVPQHDFFFSGVERRRVSIGTALRFLSSSSFPFFGPDRLEVGLGFRFQHRWLMLFILVWRRGFEQTLS
ncbi:hypothetical protein IHE45_03G050300 [Dioscorea alata]|uniref:Uncharacterized protein n=1 Tax=Dioscorea alata TaxID=55571 RepID=A0ACB7WLC4_DIOAL|nr:hypothetical protein IHE45_03G050300 [Dioscorea alata]